MNKEVTRETLLKKVFELLLEKGYDGVSVTDIQHCTGMSRGLLYHYFGSKENLFFEATRKYFADLFYIDTEEVSAFGVKEMICYITEKYKRICTFDRNGESKGTGNSIMNYDFLFYRVIQESKEFEQEYLLGREREIKVWKKALENSSIRGELREGVRCTEVARYFIYLLDGVWMDAVNNRGSHDFTEEAERALWGFYELIKD